MPAKVTGRLSRCLFMPADPAIASGILSLSSTRLRSAGLARGHIRQPVPAAPLGKQLIHSISPRRNLAWALHEVLSLLNQTSEYSMNTDLVSIPARRGKAAYVDAGRTIKVINTFGEQVVDTWAFRRADLHEFMSMEHTRATLHRLVPKPRDALLTNHRRPILTLLEDTAGGVHDTLMAACDRYRYEELGCTAYHDNCTDNLAAGLAELGLVPPETPSPLNLFMNIPWTAEGGLSFDPPVSTPGSYVVLRAEMDLIIAFSACPQDILPINGRAGKPTEAHFIVT